MTVRLVDEKGHAREVAVAAPPERVLEALSTLEGLAGWWTPTVSGSATVRGVITFAFADQKIVMRVDHVDATSLVWTCLSHSKFPEWQDTTLHFDVRRHDDGATLLAFRHVGLVPELDCYTVCSRGWDHYVDSLAAYAAGDGGSPWGSTTWRPATS